MQKSLNGRQWRLYLLIKNLTIKGEFATKEKICDELYEDYTLEENTNDNGSFTNCPKIYKDIKAINNSCEIEKIIVVDNNKIRLGNEEECIAYAEKLKEKAIKLFKRYGIIMGKVRKDGQGKIISCQNTVINENSHARPFVETYLK